MGRPVPIRAGVGASSPAGGKGLRLRAHQRAFRSPFGNLRFASRSNRAPHGTASPNPRRSRRVKPHRGRGYAPAGAPKGFPLALWKPSVATRSNRAPHGTASPNPRRSRRVRPRRGREYAPAGAPKGFPLAPCTPSDRSRRENSQELSSGQTIGAARTRRKTHGVNPDRKRRGFPQSKPSARPAQPLPIPFFRKKKGSIHAASSEKKFP